MCQYHNNHDVLVNMVISSYESIQGLPEALRHDTQHNGWVGSVGTGHRVPTDCLYNGKQVKVKQIL